MRERCFVKSGNTDYLTEKWQSNENIREIWKFEILGNDSTNQDPFYNFNLARILVGAAFHSDHISYFFCAFLTELYAKK